MPGEMLPRPVLIIHPEQAPSCTSCFLGGVNVQLPELKRRFCGGEGHYVDRAPAELAKVFTQLYQAPDEMREGYYKVKVLELLLLLSQLEAGAGPSAERSATPAQAALARKVIAYVDAHCGSRITVEQLAQALHATPEQLRYSVGRVYGKPLYQCVRAYKMRVAGRLLRETGRTVMDVAAELGYENGSKFSSAFRDVMGFARGVSADHPGRGLSQFGAVNRKNRVESSGKNRYNEDRPEKGLSFYRSG